MTQNHHFRNAYIAHHSRHNFSKLSELADNLVFCSNGYEAEDELASTIEEAMKDFDPRKDIIVPVGNVNSNMLMGAVATRKASQIEVQDSIIHWEQNSRITSTSFFVAIYQGGDYHVNEVQLGGSDA